MTARVRKPRPRPEPETALRQRMEVDVRRSQLLGVAKRLFSERAYDEVSVDDVAAAAGVSKGLFYHYFDGKRGLYVATLEVAAEELLARTEPPAELPPEERLRAGLDAFLDYVAEQGDAFVALMRGGVGSDPEVAAIVSRTRERFVTRALEGLGAARPPAMLRIALAGWVGFAEAASIEWIAHKRVKREDVKELLASALLHASSLVPR